MQYQINYYAAFKQDVKKFRKEQHLKTAIRSACDEIIANPFIGKPLIGNMQGCYNHRFVYHKNDMRIIYSFYECCADKEKCCTERDNDICRFDEEPSTELDSPDTLIQPEREFPLNECNGLIDFLIVASREDCNNIYNREKEYFEAMLRE